MYEHWFVYNNYTSTAFCASMCVCVCVLDMPVIAAQLARHVEIVIKSRITENFPSSSKAVSGSNKSVSTRDKLTLSWKVTEVMLVAGGNFLLKAMSKSTIHMRYTTPCLSVTSSYFTREKWVEFFFIFFVIHSNFQDVSQANLDLSYRLIERHKKHCEFFFSRMENKVCLRPLLKHEIKCVIMQVSTTVLIPIYCDVFHNHGNL